jgi:hypothetical protein
MYVIYHPNLVFFLTQSLAAKFTDEGMEAVLSLVKGTTTLSNVEIPYGMI